LEILNRLKHLREILLKELKQKKLEDIRLNQKVVTFLVCLAVSSFLWMVQSLSRNKNTRIFYPVTYVGLPSDKVVTNTLPKNIEIEINTNGIKYLIYKFSNQENRITINVKKLKRLPQKNHYYFLPNTSLDKISSQFNQGIDIIKIYPDTIFFNFAKKAHKKVPVKVNSTIEFDEHYKPIDSLTLTPSYVTISGSKDDINKIDFINTEPLVVSNAKQNINIKLNIVPPSELSYLEIDPLVVTASMKIGKYTEGSIELPIELKNIPGKKHIKIFPNKITVKYNIALEYYDKINPSDFRVIVDFAKSTKGSNKLKVELKNIPKEISNPKLYPDKVEFIIRK
jgi:YbbR domain-containing protein